MLQVEAEAQIVQVSKVIDKIHFKGQNSTIGFEDDIHMDANAVSVLNLEVIWSVVQTVAVITHRIQGVRNMD